MLQQNYNIVLKKLHIARVLSLKKDYTLNFESAYMIV